MTKHNNIHNNDNNNIFVTHIVRLMFSLMRLYLDDKVLQISYISTGKKLIMYSNGIKIKEINFNQKSNKQ